MSRRAEDLAQLVVSFPDRVSEASYEEVEHTIQTACFGGFASLGGSHCAGKLRLAILETALGDSDASSAMPC